MAEEGLRPIVVKKIKKGGGGHHGGAWKIAYADFVTAMMAFFLLMWLLGSTTKGDLNGISEYFKTPLKVAMQGGSGSGDSSSVIQGGGSDLSRRTGQVKMTDDPAQSKTYNLDAAKKAMEAEERSRLQALRARIEMTIDTNAELKKFKEQLLLDFTSEGLRIQIVDLQNRPMFNAGKADLQPYAREILEAIAPALNDVPNKIGLSGHTDSTPYFTETGYSNWELSADRANASRRALLHGGLADNKILRVVGLASAAHLDRADPFNPINRRISIIVMNKRTEENVLRDGGKLQVGLDTEATQAAAAAAPAPAEPAGKK
ncbi:flagellar motor protein MotB [Duganella sp. Root1480D1]|uniref:flagellar motor protein MotB n=1 Tax=Duganella sp. Root1480D1 TaxID=1736471 RepID=UPI00070E062F|nr:flagellar motor protein MotB [Duganella sp. Root1480D1]KQZ44862.1 flagellar motor protein MotB [Duganella sp. Root1480D1]